MKEPNKTYCYISRYAALCISILFVSFAFILNSCKQEEKIWPAPDISFSVESNYVNSDTTLLLGDTVKIMLIAKSKSDMPLTHINYTIYADGVKTSIDTGIFENSIAFERTVVKGIAINEIWEFYVRDRYGNKSKTISINFSKDTASVFGEIKHIPSVIFGAQNNSSLPGFYSLSTELNYSLEEAYNNSDKIDLLYYFDNIDTDENTISSPGANVDASVFPGTFAISNWSTIRTTRFVFQDMVSVEEFDNCNNDSLILSNTFYFPSGKRKAKNLQAGDIYSFIMDNDGKKGMFKVLSVSGTEAGSVEIEIKMQE